MKINKTLQTKMSLLKLVKLSEHQLKISAGTGIEEYLPKSSLFVEISDILSSSLSSPLSSSQMSSISDRLSLAMRQSSLSHIIGLALFNFCLKTEVQSFWEVEEEQGERGRQENGLGSRAVFKAASSNLSFGFKWLELSMFNDIVLSGFFLKKASTGKASPSNIGEETCSIKLLAVLLWFKGSDFFKLEFINDNIVESLVVDFLVAEVVLEWTEARRGLFEDFEGSYLLPRLAFDLGGIPLSVPGTIFLVDKEQSEESVSGGIVLEFCLLNSRAFNETPECCSTCLNHRL
mmetsp:Transcript_10774/g.16533  ORF Transcript_10774/g.16533 Transcript_10774/m.16533 type:complete len:290 (+) Transcript_10774:77-946(+)